MNNTEFDHAGNKKSYLEDEDPEHNPDAFRIDKGGLVTKDNGIADRLLPVYYPRCLLRDCFRTKRLDHRQRQIFRLYDFAGVHG